MSDHMTAIWLSHRFIKSKSILEYRTIWMFSFFLFPNEIGVFLFSFVSSYRNNLFIAYMFWTSQDTHYIRNVIYEGVYICNNRSFITVSRHAYLPIENIWGGKRSRDVINLSTQRIAIISSIKRMVSFSRINTWDQNAKCWMVLRYGKHVVLSNMKNIMSRFSNLIKLTYSNTFICFPM